MTSVCLKNKRSCSGDGSDEQKMKKRKIVEGECSTSLALLSETGSKGDDKKRDEKKHKKQKKAEDTNDAAKSVIVVEPNVDGQEITNSMELKKQNKLKSLNENMKNTQSETTYSRNVTKTKRKKQEMCEFSGGLCVGERPVVAGKSVATNDSVIFNDRVESEMVAKDSKIKKLKKHKTSRTETAKDYDPVAANQSVVRDSLVAVQVTNTETRNAKETGKTKNYKKHKTVREFVMDNESAALNQSAFNNSFVLESLDNKEADNPASEETQETLESMVEDFWNGRSKKQEISGKIQNSAKDNMTDQGNVRETVETVTSTVVESMTAEDERVQNLSSNTFSKSDKGQTKKSSIYTVNTKSFSVCAKRNDHYEGKRLKAFTLHNTLSFIFWNKVCKELKEQGFSFDTGRFSNEENEQLKKNWLRLIENCPFPKPHVLLMRTFSSDLKKEIEAFIKKKNFHIELGHNLNRPPNSVYYRARNMFHPGSYKGRFSVEETETLKRYHKEFGNYWQKIGGLMDRSGQSVFKRIEWINSRKSKRKDRWSMEEEELLIAAIKNVLDDPEDIREAYFNLPWTQIARSVKTRNAYQCKDRWLAILAFHCQGSRKFGRDKQIHLIKEIQDLNVNHECEIDWLLLKSKFDAPTPQFLQARWRKLKLKVPDFQRHTLNEVLENLLVQLTETDCMSEQNKEKQDADTTSEDVDDVELQSMTPTSSEGFADSSVKLGLIETSPQKKKRKHKKSNLVSVSTSDIDLDDADVQLTPPDTSPPPPKNEKKKNLLTEEISLPNAKTIDKDTGDVTVQLIPPSTSPPNKNKKKKKQSPVEEEVCLPHASTSDRAIGDVAVQFTPPETSPQVKERHKHKKSMAENFDTSVGVIGGVGVQLTPPETSPQKKKRKKLKDHVAEC